MNKERYKEITSKIVPQEDKVKDGIVAFLIGGFMAGCICMLVYI